MTIYRLDVYDTAGVLQYQIADQLWFAYTRRVNAPGILQFGYWGGADLLANIEDKWQVEIWRKPQPELSIQVIPGGPYEEDDRRYIWLSWDWRREFVGFYRGLHWEQPDIERAVFSCPGIESILAWQIAAYNANTEGRTRFTNHPAEDVAKTLVEYNATPAGTQVGGRDVDVPNDYPYSGLSIQPGATSSNLVNWFCARRNLLETLQELSKVGGGDFNISKTSNTTWEFRWHAGQLGIDRTSEVVFSMEAGNMGNPRYAEERINEKTVAIVGGEGESADRDIEVQFSGSHSATNHVEMFVNASDIRSKTLGTAGLLDRGDERLEENAAKTAFNFDVLQTPSSRYSIEYDLGDLVTAVNPLNGVTYSLKVRAVTVSMNSDGEETISAEVTDVF